MNSLLEQRREFFCQRRELIRRAGNRREFDATPIRSTPTHPIAPKMLPRIDWIRKYSTPVAGADEHVWLLWIGRALDARAEPRIKSADVHDETEAQRLFPGAA